MTPRAAVLRTIVVVANLALLPACGPPQTQREVAESPADGRDGVRGKADGGHSRADAGSRTNAGGPKSPGTAGPSTPGQVVELDDCGPNNAAGLSSAQVTRLAAGGPATTSTVRDAGAPTAFRFLYPYDGTVFPRGLAAPPLMWDGSEGTTDAVYVSMRSASFHYRGCLEPEAAGRVTLPQAVWDRAAAGTTGKADPFVLELSVLQGDRVIGPAREQLIIAPGSLKGSIFYNSYSSSIARAGGAMGGAVLRIPAGGTAELFIGQRGCAGCHGASADGSRLVTNEGVYALGPGTGVNPPPVRLAATEFVGVSPDGKVYAYNGQLVETDTGSAIAASNLPPMATEASFAPDGRLVTFIDGYVNTRGNAAAVSIPGLDLTGLIPASAGTGQGKLATMEFDAKARSLSGYRAFKTVSAGAQWPLFLPDDRAVLFSDTNTNDLMILDLASEKVTILARAMGFASPADAAANASYLPFADSGEARQAYFPTIAPVAAGGYFWIYFDSARRYGNFDLTKTDYGLTIPAGLGITQGQVNSLLLSKQLWVAAIEIAPDGSYQHDPSAPAFYLPGQEMGANNHRAFSALDPCLEVSGACHSGIDCCSGFCEEGQCTPPPDRCANTEEACSASSDCCSSTDSCLNGFCSVIPLL